MQNKAQTQNNDQNELFFDSLMMKLQELSLGLNLGPKLTKAQYRKINAQISQIVSVVNS